MKYFLPALALLLMALKLTGHIDWSWWWVWAPLWVPASIALGVVGLFTGLAMLSRWLETPQERKMRELQDSFKNYANALRRKSR